MSDPLLEQVLEVAAAAGRSAMEHYGGDGPIEYKEDDSPLTLADKAAHFVIVNSLQVLDPWLPVLSEESPEKEIAERKSWDDFWVVDPLDGSKEFIKQTGEFTVNIARVRGGESVLGVVHAPATGDFYYATRETGAFATRADGSTEEILVKPADPQGLRIVASKDHAGPQVEALLERLDGGLGRHVVIHLDFRAGRAQGLKGVIQKTRLADPLVGDHQGVLRAEGPAFFLQLRGAAGPEEDPVGKPHADNFHHSSSFAS